MGKEKKSIYESKVLFWATFIFLIGVFCLRFYGLDKDLPAYGVGGYNPTDEGVYSSVGLNLYNYGTINPKVEINKDISVVPYTAYHIRSNLIENLLVYSGLKLFGDNYFGFRAPMVFVSLINLLLILRITYLLIKKYGSNINIDRWILIVVEAFYVFGFPYLVSSRVVEPTLVRMTFALITFCIFLSSNKTSIRYFFSGFIITLSLQIVYITNIFFYIPIFICGCLEGLKNGKKVFKKSAICCISGCISSLVVGSIYYYTIWGSNFFRNTLSIFHDFSGLDGYATAVNNGFKAFSAGIFDYLGSNAFLFCLPLLFSFLMLLPRIIKSIFKNKNIDLGFCFFAFLGLFFQTLFTNDYVFRKGYLILPFVVFSLVVYTLETKNVFIGLDVKKRKLYLLYTLLVLLLMLITVWYRFFTKRVGTADDYTMIMKSLIIIASLIGIYAVIYFLSKKKEKGKKKIAIIITGIMLFAVNIYAGFSYVWFYNSYSEKELMVELDKYSGKPIFGAYAYGFTLYNDIKPVILTNDEQRSVVKKIPEEFVFIDTSTDNGSYIRDYLDYNMFENSRYTGIQQEEMLREWAINGNKIKFALYGIDLKSNISLRNNIERLQDEDNIDKIKRTELLCLVAAEKNAIDKKYEQMSSGKNLDDKYELLISYNNELDQLYRKYELSDSDINQITNRKYFEKDIDYILGGTKDPLYGSVYCNIFGNVEYPIFGSVYGSIYGDINAIIYGDINGNVYGDINENVYGEVRGNIYGDVIE